MNKTKFVNLVAGKTLLAASHVALSGETCSGSYESVVANLATSEKSFVDFEDRDFYLVGNDVSSLEVQISGIERCGMMVDVYLVYSFELASPSDWPTPQHGKIFVGKNIEVFDISLNVASRDELYFILDLNKVREKFPNRELVFIQAATFPSGNLGFEKAQISNIVNLALYPRPVCKGSQKAKPIYPCF